VLHSATLQAHDLEAAICNHFVHVHVRGGSSASLEDIESELVTQVAGGYVVTGVPMAFIFSSDRSPSWWLARAAAFLTRARAL